MALKPQKLFVIARSQSRNCYYAGVKTLPNGSKEIVTTANKEEALEVTKGSAQSMCLTLSTQYGFPADIRPASGRTFENEPLLISDKVHGNNTQIRVYKLRPQYFTYTIKSADIDDEASDFVSAYSAMQAAIASLDETEAA